jgi:hypothetical protein
MTQSTNGLEPIDLDRQVREARDEIEYFAKRIGELKTLDTKLSYVKSSIDFLELVIKLRKQALDKLGVSYQRPTGLRRLGLY